MSFEPEEEWERYLDSIEAESHAEYLDSMKSFHEVHGMHICPRQINEWLLAWFGSTRWTDKEWKDYQLELYGTNTSHLLRVVADMIELNAKVNCTKKFAIPAWRTPPPIPPSNVDTEV